MCYMNKTYSFIPKGELFIIQQFYNMSKHKNIRELVLHALKFICDKVKTLYGLFHKHLWKFPHSQTVI